MRFAVVTLGSAGDVIPFLAIAKTLHRRGHDIEFLTNPRFEHLAAAHGVPFHPIGELKDADRAESHPDLWHPIRGLGVLWRHLCVPALRPSYARLDALSRRRSDRPLRVLASPLALGARVARERLPIRLWTGYTAPMNLRSIEDPMIVGAWHIPPWWPRTIKRSIWRSMDVFKLHPMVRASLLKWRDEMGLPPISGSVFGDWMHSPDGGLALFPALFASRPADWPPRIEHCGFPFLDAASDLAPEVEAFLRRGEPPIVVYPGSAARSASKFLYEATQACRSLGLRTLLVAQHTDQRPAIDGEDILHQTEVPFEKLLPRSAAIVHHGGIGTCAQALRARIPQVMLPSAYDQFDNAWRAARLGVGSWQRATEVTVTLLTLKLRSALDLRFDRNGANRLRNIVDSPQVAEALIDDVRSGIPGSEYAADAMERG